MHVFVAGWQAIECKRRSMKAREVSGSLVYVPLEPRASHRLCML